MAQPFGEPDLAQKAARGRLPQTLGAGMGGIAILFLLVAYLWIGGVLIRTAWRRGSWRTGIAVALVAIALPLFDAVLGRALLRNKCEKDGILAITEGIPNVEGFGIQWGVFKDSPSYYGYRYVEGGYYHKYWYEGDRLVSSSPHMLVRAEIAADGTALDIEKNIHAKAKYLLHEGPRQDSTFFYRTHIAIREIRTDRELASFNWFEFRGGWVERILGALSDAGPRPVASCGGFEVRKKMTMELLHKTLQPAPNPAVQGTLRDKAAQRP